MHYKGCKRISAPRGEVGRSAFYFSEDDVPWFRELYNSLFSEQRITLLAEAEQILNGRIRVLGKDFRFNGGIDWQSDPLTGRHWPISFYEEIDYADEHAISDVKYTWDLNRHHHLVTLAQAYLLTGDEEYARGIVSTIGEWIDANPPFTGVNWTSPMEIAIRLINWIWAWHLIKGSPVNCARFTGKFLESVYFQAEHLHHNLTIGYYANNHLIGEAAGLAVAGIYFRGLGGHEKWHRRGLAVLEREALRQIHPDGGGAEQASGYLRVVLEFLLLAFVLANRNGIGISTRVLQRIERSMEFLMLTITPEKTAPRFGDSDDGRVLFGDGEGRWDIRPILGIGSVLFRRGDFKHASERAFPEAVWLLGREGYERFSKLESKARVPGSVLFRNSGYAVLRDPGDQKSTYLLFDCGPLGYRTCGHGHADALSFQLYLHGCCVLTDPGTFAYNQGRAVRNFFRGTSAHNTLLVDGQDQSEIVGRMAWAANTRVRINRFMIESRFNFVDAQHDGYKRLANPVVHRRKIFHLKERFFLIVDVIEGKGRHKIELNYPFSPSLCLETRNSDSFFIKSREGVIGVMRTACRDDTVTEIYRGSDDPFRGWFSEGYGRLHPSTTLSIRADCEIPFVHASLITLAGGGTYYEFKPEMSDRCTFLVRGVKEDHLIISQGPLTAEFKELDTDCRLIFLSLGRGSRVENLFVDGLKRFRWKGRRVLGSKRRVASRQVISNGLVLSGEDSGGGLYVDPGLIDVCEDMFSCMSKQNTGRS